METMLLGYYYKFFINIQLGSDYCLGIKSNSGAISVLVLGDSPMEEIMTRKRSLSTDADMAPLKQPRTDEFFSAPLKPVVATKAALPQADCTSSSATTVISSAVAASSLSTAFTLTSSVSVSSSLKTFDINSLSVAKGDQQTESATSMSHG